MKMDPLLAVVFEEGAVYRAYGHAPVPVLKEWSVEGGSLGPARARRNSNSEFGALAP
jgi:hypothetical protein